MIIDTKCFNPGKTYILAISGGVDSMTLLALLARSQYSAMSKFVVAHFDHQIRDNSHQDRELVESVAAKYGFDFEYKEGGLGADTNEQEARDRRYEFLRSVVDKHDAEAIVTAHHQDDVIETMMINLVRGTNRKGLTSLKSGKEIIRPLLEVSKQQILEVAEQQGVVWNEDSTNQDDTYLRNNIRINVATKLSDDDRASLLNVNETMTDKNRAIDYLRAEILKSVASIEDGKITFDRYKFIVLEKKVAMEVLLEALSLFDDNPYISSKGLSSLWLNAKVMASGSWHPVNKSIKLMIVDNDNFVLEKHQ